MYCMMSLNERITAAPQLIGEGGLTGHALQRHHGAKHDVHRMSEGAEGKGLCMGSVTMRSKNYDRANGAHSQSQFPSNYRHANKEDLQSPTALEPLYSMPALHEMGPTPSAPEVGPVNARVYPYHAPKTTKERKGKGFRPRCKGPKKD